MLERRVDLGVDDLLRTAIELRPYRHGVLSVAFLHAIGDERHPGRPAFRDQHLEVGMPVERAARGDLHDRSLATERRLGVVEDGSAWTRVVLAHRTTGGHVDGLGADVE